MTFTQINQRLEERAFQIWYRVALAARETPEAAHDFDLVRRIATQVSPSQVFVGRNLPTALQAVTGGGVESITTILDWDRELRACCFDCSSDWIGWVSEVSEIYGIAVYGGSVLPDSFTQTLPSPSVVRDLLLANPWALVFLVFPKLTASIFQTPKDVTVTFKRFERQPVEE